MNKLLLDTGVWLRSVTYAHTIPVPILERLRSLDESFSVSAISLWEIAKKVQIGKLSLSTDLRSWFSAALKNIEVLPISPEIVMDATSLREFPNRDPADELIVATARTHGLILLTTDTRLKGYAHVRCEYFKPRMRPK